VKFLDQVIVHVAEDASCTQNSTVQSEPQRDTGEESCSWPQVKINLRTELLCVKYVGVENTLNTKTRGT